MKPNIHQMRLFGPQLYNFYKTPLTTTQKFIGYQGALRLKKENSTVDNDVK